MPELREVWTSSLLLATYLVWLNCVHGNEDYLYRVVKGLWADASKDECDQARRNPTDRNAATRAGVPALLDSECMYQRGVRNKQTYIWPKTLWDKSDAIAGDLCNLVLERVSFDPRNILLDLSCCFLQVSSFSGVFGRSPN